MNSEQLPCRRGGAFAGRITAPQGMHRLCYTVFALSDLAVSGALPFEGSLPCTDFPKPLQRGPLSLPPGDSALDPVLVGQVF